MEQDAPDNILAFDTLFTTNHTQILKSLLPYMEADFQKKMAVYIKFFELQYTMSFLRGRLAKTRILADTGREFDLPSIYHMIKGYCSNSQKRQFEQMMQMLNTMEMMKNMQEMMEFMQESGAFSGMGAGPEDGGQPESGNFSAADMLKGMLTPEQADLFEMMSCLYGQENEKGENLWSKNQNG